MPSGDDWLADTRASYDAVAEDYADLVRHSLDEQVYMCGLLRLFADLVRASGGGPVADVGCGPGHVTGFLHGCGLDAYGVDLSPEMVRIARRDHPGLRFETGSMTELRGTGRGGIVAWYSLIHVPDRGSWRGRPAGRWPRFAVTSVVARGETGRPPTLRAPTSGRSGTSTSVR